MSHINCNFHGRYDPRALAERGLINRRRDKPVSAALYMFGNIEKFVPGNRTELNQRTSALSGGFPANDQNFETVIKFRIPRDGSPWPHLYTCMYTHYVSHVHREICVQPRIVPARGTNLFPMCSPPAGAKEQFLFQRLSVKTSHIVRHC